MTYGPTRSVNAELHEGLTDGSYKKVIQSRGGFPEAATHNARRDLDDRYFGIHETPLKTSPDGISLPTPNFVPTPPALPIR